MQSRTLLCATPIWVFVVLADVVFGAELHWTGTASGDFHEDRNWLEGRVPVDGDSVIIDVGLPVQQPEMTESTSLESIRLGSLEVGESRVTLRVRASRLSTDTLRLQWGEGSRTHLSLSGGRVQTNGLAFAGVGLDSGGISLDGDSVFVVGAAGIASNAINGNQAPSINVAGVLDLIEAGTMPFKEVIGDFAVEIVNRGVLRVAGDVTDVTQIGEVVTFVASLPFGCGGSSEFHYRYDTVSDSTDISSDPSTFLMAGDADRDLDFDQLDLVRVLQSGRYLTGESATWGEGDWNGASLGGTLQAPPPGDGRFDQKDIIEALSNGIYTSGPYCLNHPVKMAHDERMTVRYNSTTGETGVIVPPGKQLTSISIDTAAGIFTGDPAQNLGGSFDNDADSNIFKATFGGSFGSARFGNVAQTGLSREFVLGDLTVVGSLAGGGDLGPVDLMYIPEPSTVVMLLLGLVSVVGVRRR